MSSDGALRLGIRAHSHLRARPGQAHALSLAISSGAAPTFRASTGDGLSLQIEAAALPFSTAFASSGTFSPPTDPATFRVTAGIRGNLLIHAADFSAPGDIDLPDLTAAFEAALWSN